jgi:lysylphosphatidylglycerol synthetase-like protein (DUF2156 family)
MTQPPAEQPYAPPPGPGGSDSRPKGMAITALVLGVLALVLCWTIIGGLLLGLVALVLGIIAAGRAKRGAAGGRGMAITGAVLGVIGAVLAGVLVAIGASFLNSESVQDLEQCLEQAGEDQAAIDQCRVDFEEDFQN